MNERYQEVLEQYEMELLSVRKGRGAWICETDKGLKLLQEYRGTVRRLEFEDQVLEKLDTRGIVLNNLVFPMAVNALLYGVPTFLAIYFGAAYVQGIIDAIPSQIITGLSVGGNMIGAVGFALLLGSIKVKQFWPFCILGFFMASYLGINMVGIALLAVICVAMYYYFKIADDKEKA